MRMTKDAGQNDDKLAEARGTDDEVVKTQFKINDNNSLSLSLFICIYITLCTENEAIGMITIA